MRDLHESGQPVDPVTVAWEAARRGISADPADLAGGTGPFAVSSAREVRRLGLLAYAEHVGMAVEADASDRTRTPGQLLRIADGQLAAFEASAQSEQPIAQPAQVIALPRTIERPARRGAEREAAP